jgi:hypothetical protein
MVKRLCAAALLIFVVGFGCWLLNNSPFWPLFWGAVVPTVYTDEPKQRIEEFILQDEDLATLEAELKAKPNP